MFPAFLTSEILPDIVTFSDEGEPATSSSEGEPATSSSGEQKMPLIVTLLHQKDEKGEEAYTFERPPSNITDALQKEIIMFEIAQAAGGAEQAGNTVEGGENQHGGPSASSEKLVLESEEQSEECSSQD